MSFKERAKEFWCEHGHEIIFGASLLGAFVGTGVLGYLLGGARGMTIARAEDARVIQELCETTPELKEHLADAMGNLVKNKLIKD